MALLPLPLPDEAFGAVVHRRYAVARLAPTALGCKLLKTLGRDAVQMRLDRFQVTNFRNIIDSGWVRVSDLTALVGPNEAGKSNLFEALYRINPARPDEVYNIDEDWPVDQWDRKNQAASEVVCHAIFEIDDFYQIEDLLNCARPPTPVPEESDDDSGPASDADQSEADQPDIVRLHAIRRYSGPTKYSVPAVEGLDAAAVQLWAQKHVPKFVYISEYGLTGHFVELPQLRDRLNSHGFSKLNSEDQTILTVLELAKADINDIVEKGQTPQGRTQRTYDLKQASRYLSQQFSKLWRQKKVTFEIDVDGATLNIFAQDDGMSMPVRLNRRSTGFRWHVSFAWKFTHASRGEFKDCILLLEEPGVHLHPDAQRDLLSVFENLAQENTVLYTTHLATLIDPAHPERVRISELTDHHAHVVDGIVSGQKGPMAVIEARLGLIGEQSGLLGHRQTLIVEGGDDLLILTKLNGLLAASKRVHLSSRVYLWPAEGASKTPMFAGFLVGQNCDGAVLLDSDVAGQMAAKKIKELYLPEIASGAGQKFRIHMLDKAAGLKGNESAIEDLFPVEFYLECVNAAYRIALLPTDLPVDGSSMITKRVAAVMEKLHGQELDKRRVLTQMLSRFDEWEDASHLPAGTADAAEKLFGTINKAFGSA